MDSPFAFVGSSSLEDNFIGRKDEIDFITKRVISGGEMTCLVGLPRIGKTSLMWHIFFEEGKTEWWFSNHNTIPVYTDIGKQPSAKNIWGAIATSLNFELFKRKNILKDIDANTLNSIKDDLKWITIAEDAADRHNHLESCLKKIKDSYNIKFLFVFDELDYLWKYKYSQDQFHQIRSMSVYGHVVTCSRRKPSYIEKMACNSNYFDNKSKYIWISPFLAKDAKAYWQHFRSFFRELDDNSFDKYIKLVERYTGNHPHMMNIMNNEAFESGNLKEWHQTIDRKRRYETERKFRFSLEEAFKRQMGYIKEQELEESAKKLVLEGVELPSKEHIEDLKNYGFIKQVPLEVKRNIFGYDMGPTTNEDKDRFICMSEFFSHLMKEEYEPTIKGLQLLRTTEIKMRRFVKELLKKEYGQNCMESDEDESSPYYKEKWEQHFEPREDEWIESQMTKEEIESHKKEINNWKKAIQIWEQRRDSRYKRVCNGCKPSSERPPIDTLSSFDIGSIIYTFFDKKKPWSTDAMVFAKMWKSDFQKWGLWRNAEQHFYVEEKTEVFLNKAHDSCHKICKDIDDWIRQEQSVV